MHSLQSFGETDILENGSYVAGRLRVTAVRADPALTPRLRITLGVQLQRTSAGASAAASPPPELREIAGELHALHATGPGPDGAGRDGLGVYVGRLLSAGPPRVVPVLAYGYETSVELACDLPPLALERLEALRAGRALLFTLTPWFSVWAEGRPVDTFAARAFGVRVPQEHWLDALAAPGGFGPARAALLEVRFAPADAVPFGAAAERLRSASRLLDRGHYAEAVGQCRIAYEALLGEQPGWAADGGKGLWTALAPAFHVRTAPLYKQIAGALKQLSALTHHVYGADVAFSRTEALFVVTTTASFIAMLGEASTRAHETDDALPRVTGE